MENYKIIEPYAYDTSMLRDCTNFNQMLKKIIFLVGTQRHWEGLEGTEEKYSIRAWDQNEFPLGEAGVLYTALFAKDAVLNREHLLVHAEIIHERKAIAVHVFVFPEVDVADCGDGYYEHGVTSCFPEDGYLVFQRENTYADIADIHDHDHYTVIAQAKYDIKNTTLYYPESP